MCCQIICVLEVWHISYVVIVQFYSTIKKKIVL